MKRRAVVLIGMLLSGAIMGYLTAGYYIAPKYLPLIQSLGFGAGMVYFHYAATIIFALIIALLIHAMIYDHSFRFVALHYIGLMCTSALIARVLTFGVIVPFVARFGFAIKNTGDCEASLTIMMAIFLSSIKPPTTGRIVGRIRSLRDIIQVQRVKSEPELKWF